MSTSRRPMTYDEATATGSTKTPDAVAVWQRDQLAKRHKLADQGGFATHAEAEHIAARLLKNG